jgi:hypothetical protein
MITPSAVSDVMRKPSGKASLTAWSEWYRPTVTGDDNPSNSSDPASKRTGDGLPCIGTSSCASFPPSASVSA